MSALSKLNSIHFIKRIVYKIRRRPKIKANQSVIGKNVVFGKNVRIHSKNLRLGDGCVIGDNVEINCEHFEMGDYGVIYKDCYFPGGQVKIGHNFWLGVGSIVDGRAGTTIGNNVGIGAHSQLWTHMSYGDMLKGCRFHSERPLVIGNDVWLVGHNLISPVTMEDKSMAMLGSLVTRDMKAHRTYAGSPAVDLTEKLGTQFKDISEAEQVQILEKYLTDFATKFGLGDFRTYIHIQTSVADTFTQTEKIQINPIKGLYKKNGSVLEYYLMLFLLPDIKLLPV